MTDTPPAPAPAPAIRVAAQGAMSRNGAIDLLRFAGAVAIVWFHLGMPYSSLALSALPMFVMLSVGLASRKSFSDRMRRFMVPWLFWSMIYGIGKFVDVISGRGTLADEFRPWMLLAGPAIHLWFLPFMLLALLLLVRITSKRALWVSAALAFIAINLWVLPWPVAQWLHVWPAAVIAATGGYGFGLAVFTAASFTPISQTALQTAVAATAVLLARAVPVPSRPWMMFLNGLSLGIYLIHPLAASICLRLTGEIRFLPIMALTIALTVIIKRITPQIV